MFQLFDGIQAVSAGVLRGLGDTRAPFVVNLAGFWLCGFPLSVALAFHTPLRALGLWWGLAAGLAVVATLLLFRVRNRLRGALIQVEHAVEARVPIIAPDA
jgi:MATE family multidrug resistance protein